MNEKKKDDRKMTDWISLILKVLLASVVAIFLASESLNFFSFVFPAEQWYLSYTGLGLTMGTAFVYLYLLLHDAKTSLTRVIALIMVLVGIVGELATAGFGMQVEAWKKIGYVMVAEDIDFMILIIRILMLIQGVALLAYFAGDRIVWMFKDDDRDGILNFADRQDNRQQNNHGNNQSRHDTPLRHNNPQSIMAQDTKREELPDADPTPGANRNNNSRQ